MTSEEQEQVNEICRRVIAEKDPNVFEELLQKLNDLLDKKYNRIQKGPSADSRFK